MSSASTSGRRLFQSSSSRSISARSAMPPIGSIRTTQSVALWARRSAPRDCVRRRRRGRDEREERTSAAVEVWQSTAQARRPGRFPRSRSRKTRRVRRKTARPASSESGLPATYCRLFGSPSRTETQLPQAFAGQGCKRTWGDPDAAAGSPRTSPGRARRLEGGSILDSEPESGLRCVPADIGHPYRE